MDESPGDLAGPSLRSSRLGHPLFARSLPSQIVGSEPADQPPAATRRIDAAGALNVQRLLDRAARSDGFDGLSDQLAADLDELLGGRNALRTIAVELSEQTTVMTPTARSPGSPLPRPSDGDWTMQVVTDPRRRHDDDRSTSRRADSSPRSPSPAADGRLVGLRPDGDRRIDRRRIRVPGRSPTAADAAGPSGRATAPKSPLVRSSRTATRRPG